MPATSLADRYVLVEQAITLLDGLYEHAMCATDPVQRLRLLERRLQALSATCSSTATWPPSSAACATCTPPTSSLRTMRPGGGARHPRRALQDRDGTPRYLATRVHPALEGGGFTAGVQIREWNGIPIERAVELNAERHAGSNPAARLARGLQALTVRRRAARRRSTSAG